MRTIFCLLLFFVFYIPLIYGDLEPAKNVNLHGISNKDYYIKNVRLHKILNSDYYIKKDIDLYSPEKFYGFPLTEDRILVDYEQLVKYYQYLDKDSPYVKLEHVGYSTENKKIYQVIISSKSNLANLENILEKQKILSDPRIKGEMDINELINSQPMILFVGLSIHANEITATQMAPNFIHKLLSIKDEYLKDILDKIVLVFSITINPDGVDRVVHWYWDTLGTKAEGTTPPFLYQKYAGHDNNRDYFMNNLTETRVWSEQLFKRLYPTIVYDIHEMGNTGPRFFVPPFDDPANPEVHSTIIRDIELIGGAVASDLAFKNLEGVVTNGIYDMWWHGGLRPAPYYHNQIGILTEAARVDIASPVFIDFDELIGRRGIPSTQERYINFTDVWEGGEWHSKDIAKYEEETLRSLIEVSVKYRKDFIKRFYNRNVEAIEEGQTEPPYGYVFNINKSDKSKLLWLMEVLNFQGIELYVTKDAINMGDDIFPANSFIVLSTQPQRPNILALLSKQEYPPRFIYPDGPPEPPYDIASWNLIQQMNLEVKQLGQPLPEYVKENLIKIKPTSNLSLFLSNNDNLKNRRINFLNRLNSKGIDLTGKVVGHASEGGGYIFSPTNDNYAVVINRLREKGYNDLYFTVYRVRYEDKVFPVNTCVVSHSEELYNFLESLTKELSINFYAISDIDQLTLKKTDEKKVALYESYNENYPTGWLQFVLDAFEFKYSTIHNKDIKEGNLNSKYDLILFGSESYEDIMDGRDVDRYLDEYAGGIGEKGLNNIKEFLLNGGNLLLIDKASDLAIKGLKAPVRNILDNVSDSEFYCPGSILNMHLEDLNNNLFAGYSNKDIFAYFKSSPTFEVLDDKNIKVLATWPQNSDDILASGWILGEDLISGKPAILDVKYGEGNIIMTAFDVVHRGQPHVTFKLLFNAILNKFE